MEYLLTMYIFVYIRGKIYLTEDAVSNVSGLLHINRICHDGQLKVLNKVKIQTLDQSRHILPPTSTSDWVKYKKCCVGGRENKSK